MATYVRKIQKEIACELEGFRGALLWYLNHCPDEIMGHEKRIKTIRTYCKTMIDDVLHDVEENHLAFCRRQLENLELVLQPSALAKRNPLLSILSTQDVQDLCRVAQWQCLGCDLDKIAQRKCELKALFLRCGAAAVDNGKGVCPFKRGL